MIKAEIESSKGKPSVAVANLVEASNKVAELIDWGDWMWKNLNDTWEKSRYEKHRSVAGHEFLHVMDDVKDHFADRRTGLDYMIAPFQRLDLPDWRTRLYERIKNYSASNNVQIKGLDGIRLED